MCIIYILHVKDTKLNTIKESFATLNPPSLSPSLAKCELLLQLLPITGTVAAGQRLNRINYKYNGRFRQFSRSVHTQSRQWIK